MIKSTRNTGYGLQLAPNGVMYSGMDISGALSHSRLMLRGLGGDLDIEQVERQPGLAQTPWLAEGQTDRLNDHPIQLRFCRTLAIGAILLTRTSC